LNGFLTRPVVVGQGVVWGPPYGCTAACHPSENCCPVTGP
jgi:hypothetical protein